jgi:predicted Zn finger-like uncharacterized protein
MKIECDKCAAKYSIADEKVRGKTFKIRCKKCSNVIIVRDKAAGAGALGGEAEAPASVGWHLAINGETIGPMGEDEVRQRFAAGEIDRDTAIWQEGFEDWLPLGDVETFADLAAGGAAAAEDPFASANQDEYAAAAAQPARASAAAAVAAPVARAAASGGAAVSEPSSPRVTRLTGQRNENSVLFSLDSLQSLATGGDNNAANSRAAQQQRSGPKGLATQAPSSEGSGLIDIRALGAMVGSDAGPTPVSAVPKPEDATLPSFGGASLGGLASAPLVPQVHSVDAGVPMMAVAPAQPQRSNAPLYVMMVLLLLAVAGLGAYIVMRPNETVVVNQAAPAADAPTAKDDDKDKDKDESDAKVAKDDKGEKDEAGKDEAGKDEEAKAEAGGADTEGEAAEGDDAKADPDKPKSTTKPSSKPGTPASKPNTTPTSKPATPTPAKPTPSNDNLDVDCILDPKLPKCKGGGGSSKPSGGTPKPTPAPTDPSLPETLGTADIKAGVSPVKDAAKACGSKHGAQPGESVKVKLSIAGATGAVTSAAAEPPHNGTPLGNCVAAALKKATFKKFRKATLGAVYPVKM